MVRQKDIAAKLGVSVALVSRALSGKARNIGIPERTIERIRKEAEAMGYVPNVTARILKGAASRTLGVLVQNYSDPFLGPIIGELQQLASASAHSLVIENDNDKRHPLNLIKHGIDGLILVGSRIQVDAVIDALAPPIPVACIGHAPDHPRLHSVQTDEGRGMALLMDHLEELGLQRMGFLGGSHPVHLQRRQLFDAEIAARPALETRPEWACTEGIQMAESAYQGTAELLRKSKGELPDVLVVSSDIRALGVMRALKDAGLSVPDDISVTGFDDIPLAHMCIPSLTTVRQPITEMARTAFQLVTSDEGPIHGGGRTQLQPRLVARESTATLIKN